ncbi:MAG: FtsB family cell division protein [Thermodesulfobacteriota bacterium]
MFRFYDFAPMLASKKLRQLNITEVKGLVVLCVFSLSAIALWLTFSPNGLLAYRAVMKEKEAVLAENERLREENRVLQQTLEKIRNDPSYLEEIARRDHKFLKKNEKVFEFK